MYPPKQSRPSYFIYLFTFATYNKYYREKMKKRYVITKYKISQFIGQEKLQKLNVILSDLTFVIYRVARKPNRS